MFCPISAKALRERHMYCYCRQITLNTVEQLNVFRVCNDSPRPKHSQSPVVLTTDFLTTQTCSYNYFVPAGLKAKPAPPPHHNS